MPTPVHRPFRIAAINEGHNPVGLDYGFEQWRYMWWIYDPDGHPLACSSRYPRAATVAEARASILDALDAFGVGDAALRLDPFSVAEAAGTPPDATPPDSTPPGPRPRPIRIRKQPYGWYWTLIGADGHEVGGSIQYDTEQECYDSVVRAVAAVYGMAAPLGELIDVPPRRPWWRRWWVR